LVFANSSDGYAFGTLPLKVGLPLSVGDDPSTVFATTDGGRSWHAFSFGSHVGVMQLVASANVFYSVLASCTKTRSTTGVERCSNYRLARSAAGSLSWSTVPIPGTAALGGIPVDLGAEGSQVFMTYQTVRGTPELLESTRGRPPFRARRQPSLDSVIACGLFPMAEATIWAFCPTGMLESWLRSDDGGGHFTRFWTTAGTGGGVLDPVTNDIAYREFGLASRVLERTTGGGKRFVTVAPLPPNGGTQLVFLDEEDGFALGANQHTTLMQTLNGGVDWTRVKF
jgi:hypothetical protein